MTWTYEPRAVVTSVSPAQGQEGVYVAISGTNLLGAGTHAVNVSLNGVPVESITSSNETLIEVVAGSSTSSGTGNIVIVSNTGAEHTAVNRWSYTTASTIVSFAPSSGQVGTYVTISGERLLGSLPGAVTEVSLAGVDVAGIVSQNSTEIVVRAASNGGSASSGAIVLRADNGARTTSIAPFSYLPMSMIATVQPSSGQIGTLVTISGANMLGGGSSIAFVSLAGVGVANIVSGTDSTIVVEASSAMAGVNGSVFVMSDSGATTAYANGFEYVEASNIVSVSPSVGQLGTMVEINGTNLRGYGSAVSGVTLDGVAAQVISE